MENLKDVLAIYLPFLALSGLKGVTDSTDNSIKGLEYLVAVSFLPYLFSSKEPSDVGFSVLLGASSYFAGYFLGKAYEFLT